VVLASLALVLVLAVAGLGGFYVWATGAPDGSGEVHLTIVSGSTTAEVAALLREEGVIRSPFMFRLLARFNGVGGAIEAGAYTLPSDRPLGEVFDLLEAGPEPIPTVGVTFPEGWELRQVAARAAAVLGIDRRAFMELTTSGQLTLPPFLRKGASTVEGFLFPKTYEFFENPSEQEVARTLLDQFEIDTARLPWKNAADLGVSEYEIVVIASLIEREAKVPEDRGKIARVIYNRLTAGMRLEIDATIQYAIGERRRITNADKEVDSPYNTYLHDGLPPTPIANPGLPSIRAALKPTPGAWLYYLTVDDSGRHQFFETYEEFLRALQRRGG